jgi:hypothetical protein
MCWHRVGRVASHDERLELPQTIVARPCAGDLIEPLQMGLVEDHRAAAQGREDPREARAAEGGVDRGLHRPDLGEGKPRQEKLGAVREHNGDHVTATDPDARQASRDAVAFGVELPECEIGVGHAQEAPVGTLLRTRLEQAPQRVVSQHVAGSHAPYSGGISL